MLLPDGDFPDKGQRVLLILGTDTNVGKTRVSSALAGQYLASGEPVTYLKPFQTGVSGASDPEGDAFFLRARYGSHPLFRATTWRFFPDPIDPMTAAKRVGVDLSTIQLKTVMEQELSASGKLVIEGAGGVLSPVFPDGQGILAAFSNVPWPYHLILVSHPHLGTLSSTLLSVNYLREVGSQISLSLILVPRPIGDQSLAARLNPDILAGLLPDIGVYRMENDRFLRVPG